MIKKYRLILIAAFALVASVCLFTGCQLSINQSFDDFVDKNKIKSSVTYILNEGSFANNNYVFDMYYPTNAKPYEITQDTPAGASIGNARINNYAGHEFLGWYLAETNEDGVPYYTDGTLYGSELAEGERKSVRMTEVKFDFSKRLNDGDKYYLVAAWKELPKVIVKLIPQGFHTLTSGDKNYILGSELNTFYIPSSGLENMGKYVFEAKGYTFLSFHKDEGGNENFTDWPIRIPEDNSDVTIYAKFIEGEWEIVKTASDFEKLFRSGGNLKNYYFMPEGDVKEIDCSNLRNVAPLALYGGKIAGNGCKIKNLTVSQTNISLGATVALFGELKSTAVIENLTLENLTVNYSFRRGADASAYFVCTNIEQGAAIKNVIVGGQMTIKLNTGSILDNTTQENWLFGRAPAALTSGVTVSDGTKCVIENADGTTAEYEYKN